MLKNVRKINYMVGLAGKKNYIHTSWTGIQLNFWPLAHPWRQQVEGEDTNKVTRLRRSKFR